MVDNRRRKSDLLMPLLWMGAGFLSWYLSTFLFSYLLSPLLITRLRTINTVTQSSLIKNTANMIYANAADYGLCFLFSILLSYLTKFTKYRLAMFIFGAIAIGLYMRVEGLLNQMKSYAELPSWPMSPHVQGFISLLLIVPLISLLGCKLGRYLSVKKKK